MTEKLIQEEEEYTYTIKVGQATYSFGTPCPTLPQFIIFKEEGKNKDDSAQSPRRQ